MRWSRRPSIWAVALHLGRLPQNNAAVKAHVLHYLHSAIHVFTSLTAGKVHDVKILDQVTLQMGSLWVADRAYLGFARLNWLNSLLVGLVLRTKTNALESF